MPEYSRSGLLDYFKGLSQDSRACRPGFDPIMTAFPFVTSPAASTTLDSKMVWELDQYCRAKHKAGTNWHRMTAGEIALVVGTVLQKEGEL